jgi:hypothetical protein
MKLPLKPVALAVTLALASAAANAQLAAPQYGTAPPTNADNTSLILFVWSPAPLTGTTATANYGEQVSLNYSYSQLLASTGNLTPSSSTSPFVTAANPTGAAGNVLQLNFGTVPNFSQFTGSGAGPIDYFVAAANGNATGANEGIEISDSTTPNTSNLPASGVATVQGLLNTISWNGTGGNTGVDTTGSQPWNPVAGTVNSGNMDGINFGGAVNSALNFYNATVQTSGRSTSDTITEYTNANGAGFWFLSSSGDLTWDVPLGTPTVPLPAAVWLFASGLAGLGAISRRRRQEIAAA